MGHRRALARTEVVSLVALVAALLAITAAIVPGTLRRNGRARICESNLRQVGIFASAMTRITG